MPSDAEIAKSRRDPVKLAEIVDNLNQIMQIKDAQQHKIRQLRWEFTRQLHLHSTTFWLEGKQHPELTSLHDEYFNEFEIVFGKKRPDSCGSKAEDAKAWAMGQKRHWEDAQEVKNIDESTDS